MAMKKTAALSGSLKRRTRAQAIRAKCMDCCCDYTAEVRNCELKEFLVQGRNSIPYFTKKRL